MLNITTELSFSFATETGNQIQPMISWHLSTEKGKFQQQYWVSHVLIPYIQNTVE